MDSEDSVDSDRLALLHRPVDESERLFLRPRPLPSSLELDSSSSSDDAARIVVVFAMEEGEKGEYEYFVVVVAE